jgi:hypothetical protein
VVGRGPPVDPGHGAIDPHEAQVRVEEAEADRRGLVDDVELGGARGALSGCRDVLRRLDAQH